MLRQGASPKSLLGLLIHNPLLVGNDGPGRRRPLGEAAPTKPVPVLAAAKGGPTRTAASGGRLLPSLEGLGERWLGATVELRYDE